MRGQFLENNAKANQKGMEDSKILRRGSEMKGKGVWRYYFQVSWITGSDTYRLSRREQMNRGK